MSNAATAKFACSSCGKTYTWKPQFAGKKLKCSCGQLMQAPESLDAPAPELEPQLDNLYDVGPEPTKPKPKRAAPPSDGPPCPACNQPLSAPDVVLCIHCGHNLKSGKKTKTTLAKTAPAAPAAVAGYVAGRPKLQDEPKPRFDLHAAKQNIIPLALVVIGAALTVLLGTRHTASRDTTENLVFLGIGTTIDLVLIMIGIFATAKMLGLSFGAIGPAILKICAVSLTPGAIAGLIIWVAPSNGPVIAWAVSALLYCGLFMFLFDLDLGETLICIAIIWLIRNWLGMIILMMLLSAFRSGLIKFGG
jgi:hypothetical protein